MRFPLFLAAAPLALAACSQSGDTDESGATGADTAGTATATETATTASASADGASTAATDPQGFVNAAAASDMFEIESGKLAQSKGTSDAVKEFGAMMVRDHTKSTADLKTAAATANVTPAPEMTAKQQSDLTALQGASGDNFDTLYKQQQLAAHQQALALLQGQANGGTAASLKAFAAKTAPVVQQHLEHVQRLP